MQTRVQKQEQVQADFLAETRLIIKCKFACSFINHGQTVLFREEGMPRVDFYPSSGKWKAGDQSFEGGAQAFLDWYARQRKV